MKHLLSTDFQKIVIKACVIVQPVPRISRTTSDLIWKQIRLNSEGPRSLSLASVTWVSFVVKDTKPYFLFYF